MTEQCLVFAAGILLGTLLGKAGRQKYGSRWISSGIPLLEPVNGFLYVWIFRATGRSFESALYCGCASVLLFIAIVDERTFEIPIECNWLIGGLGCIRLLLDLSCWQEYLAGFFAVSGLLLLAGWLTEGKQVGGGDIKLMAAAGLLLGPGKILAAFFIAVLAAAFIHLPLMKLAGKGRVLALGPYLSFGILIAMLYGDEIVSWYFSV